jgi:nitrite reductase/ring-hydroxylating ferredoxin subunit
MLSAEVNGKLILVANVSRKYYAIGNKCTHRGCKLSDGILKEGGVVECSCHGSNFDLKTGNVVKGPATMPEPAFQVKVQGDDLLVDLPSETNDTGSEIDLS